MEAELFVKMLEGLDLFLAAGWSKQRSRLCEDIQQAVQARNAPGLQALLTSCKGEDVAMFRSLAPRAAGNGDTRCLHILKENGFTLNTQTWEQAARCGQVNCLAYALTYVYALEDSVLWYAVKCAHLACVEFLLQQRLPQGPHMHFSGLVDPEQMKCYQLLAGNKVHIHPASSIVAAYRCDVDFLRWLHKYGVPLWQHAREREKSFDLMCPIHWSVNPHNNPPSTFVMSDDPHSLNRMWQALRYGSLHGAPVTPRVQALFGEKRERTQAVLRCFKAAVRLSQGPPAAPKQGGAWASMGALPSVLVEEILILADLEILEAFVHCP